MANKALFFTWLLTHFLSPLVFFALSRSKRFDFQRTLLDNFFTYFLVFQIAHILVGRLVFDEGHTLEFSSVLFLFLPVVLIMTFFIKSRAFIWLYSSYATGTALYYLLNMIEPRMSVFLNMSVITEYVILQISYLWYLKKYHYVEFIKTIEELKSWLNDYDKRRALWMLSPLIFVIGGYLLVFLVILFKFKHVIFARLFNW